MHAVGCNLCGCDEAEPVAEQGGYRMVRCRGCGLVYQDPRPEPGELLRLYEGYHRRDGRDESTWARLMSLNFAEAADMLDRMFPARGRLLDIGCGYGHFIELMRDRGWDVSGIEPSGGASAYARAKGLDVWRTALEEAALPEASFEVVTAFYVLEHLCDPLGALVRIRGLLRPGGAVVLRLPHTTPIVGLLGRLGIRSNLYDLPFHLYDFSPATISSMLEKAGFTDIRVMPGMPTVPPRPAERVAALLSGRLARLLFGLSGGRFLLPGVSKTTVARRPPEVCRA
jgi:SAM-dependent methyltransferase